MSSYTYQKNVIDINKAQCLLCGDIIESTHGHDFQTCSCGNLSVDGGKEYLRRVFREDKLIKFVWGHPPGAKTWVELSESHTEERDGTFK